MSHQLVLAILVSKMTTTEYLLISGQSYKNKKSYHIRLLTWFVSTINPTESFVICQIIKFKKLKKVAAKQSKHPVRWLKLAQVPSSA